MFGYVTALLKSNITLMANLDAEMDFWNGSMMGLARLFGTVLDNKTLILYLESLPRALATLETICDTSPHFIGYLQECKRHAETLRKSEPYEEDGKDMTWEAVTRTLSHLREVGIFLALLLPCFCSGIQIPFISGLK